MATVLTTAASATSAGPPRHRAAVPSLRGRSAHLPAGLLSALPLVLVVVVVVVGRATTVPDAATTVARALHLVSLVAGLGAVLTVDLQGLRWLAGRSSLDDVLDLAARTHLLVWAGYLGLASTGALLVPATLSTLTLVKLAATAVVGCNGAWFLLRQRHPGTGVRFVLVSAAVSQAGWWTAATIGFLNAHG